MTQLDRRDGGVSQLDNCPGTPGPSLRWQLMVNQLKCEGGNGAVVYCSSLEDLTVKGLLITIMTLKPGFKKNNKNSQTSLSTTFQKICA